MEKSMMEESDRDQTLREVLVSLLDRTRDLMSPRERYRIRLRLIEEGLLFDEKAAREKDDV